MLAVKLATPGRLPGNYPEGVAIFSMLVFYNRNPVLNLARNLKSQVFVICARNLRFQGCRKLLASRIFFVLIFVVF